MPSYTRSPQSGALRQCEILANVVEVRVSIGSLDATGELEIEERVHPLAIVVTQDCDLLWDYRAREASGDAAPKNKILPNVLLCELWEADLLRGTQAISSEPWKRIRQNQDERYHYLQPCDTTNDSEGSGLSALVIDFKRVFTVPTDELYRRVSIGQIRRRSMLEGLFLQDLSNRFGYYHLRVALPDAVPSSPPALQLPPPEPPETPVSST